MVTRKPLPRNATIDPNIPPKVRMQDMRQELWSATESEGSTDRPWADSTSQQPGDSTAPADAEPNVPESLRPGGPGAYTNLEEEEENVWGEESARLHHREAGPDANLSNVPQSLQPGAGVARSETNPFKRKPSPRTSHEAVDVPPMPTQTPPVPPVQSLSQLSLNESSNNPWQPALDVQKKTGPAPNFTTNSVDQDSSRDVWGSSDPSRAASTAPGSTSPVLVSLPSEEGSAWGDDAAQKTPTPMRAPPEPVDNEVLEDSHAWDDLGTQNKGKAPMKIPPIPKVTPEGPVDDWNLIDNEPVPDPPQKQDSWENFVDAEDAQTETAQQSEEQGPTLPPRKAADVPPQKPPRPLGEKTETYQIKNINWYDVNAAKNPRTSPILVQNANGPCPLVALVNALTLTTPPDLQNTALVETLRSREQVSLGLLLDAVIDELMSSRRTNPDIPLPDVFELYKFLQGLHTGMNVNPRFIPTAEVITAYKRTSLTHLHPMERGDLIPGTFEDTKEMSLYATFSIPLIHGWLPPRAEPVYEALNRRAVSYEDVQNLLFMEEELEEKLSGSSSRGLSEEEQGMYQDILTIKSFLSISATQLTPWGLEVITKATRPGTVAILFRNDHFSTLYRHPQTLQLLGLVTDAGYASHDEVVWESLVDVNGEHSEFFSGDFRLVGGANQQSLGSASKRSVPGSFPGNSDSQAFVGTSTGSDNGWTTVQGKRGKGRGQPEQEIPMSPTHEQEDRDLALALQLQEEEDERHREEQAQRRRESLLSEQFIEQQAHQPSPAAARGGRAVASRGRGGAPITVNRRSSSQVNIPVTTTGDRRPSTNSGSSPAAPRGGGTARPVQQHVRPLVPPANSARRPAEDGLDEAPPSYEQAAKATPYVPPEGHPTHPSSSPSMTTSSPGPNSPSASSTRVSRPPPAQSGGPSNPGRPNHRLAPIPPAGVMPSTSSGNGKDKDCVVM